MFLEWIIPVFSQLFTSVFFRSVYVPILCLAFLASVPFILRYFFRR